MANILDIEKISEIGKIDIPNLKLILRELLDDIRENEEQNKDTQIDISVILKLLFEKGLISKEEYENLKDKINSMIDSDKVDNAYDDELSDEVIEEIISKSHFKGFFPNYEELILKFPSDKVSHGDFAYVRDFNAGIYDVNDIEEFVFDIKHNKWMSASDTTHLRNVYIREDEDDVGRYGQPLNNDLLQYNSVIKRWICKTYEEADIARKSHLDFHTGNQIKLTEDKVGGLDGSIKDDGRLIIELNTEVPNYEPMHISKETFKKLLEEIDKDYFTRVHIDTEIDEFGVEKIIITDDDNDEYGNAIRRNITNDVLRKIINNMYDKLLSTFDIQKDSISGRLININEKEPAKYVPHGINTYNVDKIIDAINKDYNNAFKLSDKEVSSYVDILKRVLEGYNELDINEYNVQSIIDRLTKLYENKTLWDRYTNIISYEKNKNITPEVFNELIDLIHYLYISKDLIRDEILERDIILNGKKTFTNDLTLSGKKINITNPLCEFLINAGIVHFNNNQSVIDIDSKEININNSNGVLNVSPDSNFEKDVTIKGNLTVKGTTTTINSENLTVEDNIIVVNKGEIGNGVSRRVSGVSIDRGNENNYFFGYDENRKRLTAGYISNESDNDFDALNNIALLPKEELDIEKPIVYNPENKLLINSEYIKTDIDGATTFKCFVSNPEYFNILDCVCFIDGVLEKCSFKSYEHCEVIGVISSIKENTIVIVVNGKIPLKVNGVKDGTVLLLQEDGTLNEESLYPSIIRRKVAIQTPDGIIVDIQKNSGLESTDINREQICHRLVDPGTKLVRMENSFELNNKTKVFFDGALQVRDIHYRVDYECHAIEILKTYSYRLDVMVITNLDFAYSKDEYIDDSEIDEIFAHTCPEPRPPFEDTVYVKNYEVDRIFGIISNDPNDPSFNEDNVGWASDEDIDDIFSARLMYSKLNMLDDDIQKDTYRDGDILYFVTKENIFEICDFLTISSDGKYKTISDFSENIIGIIEDKQYFDGLIEYKLNTSRVISYNEIKLTQYSNRYKVKFEYGDSIYLSGKINKFSGNKIGTFSEYGLFLEYVKKEKENKISKDEARIINLKGRKYYNIKTDKLSINTLNLFEQDSPNYCQLNLINNTAISDKNLFAEIVSGKKLFELYRIDDEFIIYPIRDVICKSDLLFKEIEPKNLIKVL